MSMVENNCLVDLELSVTPETSISTHLTLELWDGPHSHVDLFWYPCSHSSFCSYCKCKVSAILSGCFGWLTLASSSKNHKQQKQSTVSPSMQNLSEIT